jgi:serine phosphatase RsbU (regulator of sigma subunit)
VHELDGAGGDLVDIRGDSNGTMAVTLADITGHGREAARYAVRLRNVLAALDKRQCNQQAWLTRINRRLCRLFDDEHFCAAIHVRMRWSTRHRCLLVSLANAGMPAPIIYRAATDRVDRLAFGAPPLGVFSGDDWLPQPMVCTLKPGDTLLLFSDGLTEARGSNQDLFGERRIARIVRTLGPANGDALLTGLTAALSRFAGNGRLQDDVAMVAVRAGMVHELTAASAAA